MGTKANKCFKDFSNNEVSSNVSIKSCIYGSFAFYDQIELFE